MLNRLATLHPEGEPVEVADVETGLAKVGKVDDVDSEGKSGQPKYLVSFFKQVEEFKASIKFIGEQAKNIDSLRERVGKAIGSDAENEISKELQSILMVTNKRCEVTKQSLEDMKQETAKLQSNPAGKETEIRIRQTQVATLTQKFVEVVRAYQLSQTSYKTKMKEKVARQVRVVKPNATYEEIEAAIVEGSSKIYQKAILQKGDPVQEAYLKVQNKYKDVLTLQRNVEELLEMFRDLSLLVESQGELVDQIEYQVTTAGDYIVTAKKHLDKAVVARKQIRKKYCFFALILLVIIVAILAPILNSLN